MDEFLNNLRQNPSSLYLLIAFVLLWGAGMLWGVVVVIKHLRKKNKSVNRLKQMGFIEIDDPGAILQVRNIAINTLWQNFSFRVDEQPRRELLKIAHNTKELSVTYEIPRDEYRRLPRATGLKEMIQIVNRKMVLSKILFRSGKRKAFYAKTKDTETIRAFKPRTRIKSTIGWAICFAGKNDCKYTCTIHRKFTGHKKFLMDMALRMAQLKPVPVNGMLAEFDEEFDIKFSHLPDSQCMLEGKYQRIILKYKEYIPEGLKLSINNEGVWITGEEWLDKEQTVQMIKLCDELLDSLRQEMVK